jgi:CRP/FNR family cyclic AMP-dependent transcriptional regulator
MATAFESPFIEAPAAKTAVFDKPMGTSAVQVQRPQPRQLEDPLAHLPCSIIVEYRKGDAIYNQQMPPANLHLVIDGKVKVCRLAEDGRQVVVDIYQPDEFFGESAFVGEAHHSELAVALEDTRVMSWTIVEIEDISARRPKLAIALVQLLVQRSMEFGSRIESFSVDNIARRLARALLRFSERLGQPGANGGVQMIPFTHELLSQYVGTSREIVTQYMNQFRRQGFLRYSRRGIMLDRDALQGWLAKDPAAESAKL